MTEQTRADLAARRDAVHPSAEHGAHGHNTTPMAWVIVVEMIAAFIVGGIALIYWNWPLFWASIGMLALGIIVGWMIGIMEMVTEYGSGGRGGDPGHFGYSARSDTT